MTEAKVGMLPSARRAAEEKAAKSDQQAALIKLLESLLVRAKDGYIDGIACAVHYAPGTPEGGDIGGAYIIAPDCDVRLWSGALDLLKLRMTLGLLEIPELNRML